MPSAVSHQDARVAGFQSGAAKTKGTWSRAIERGKRQLMLVSLGHAFVLLTLGNKGLGPNADF